MKKIFVLVLAAYIISPSAYSQDDNIRRPAIGISFFMNDFLTPQRIKASNVAGVLRDKQWARFKDMNAGLALNYFKGLKKYIDFSASLSGSFLRYPFPNRSFSNENFLLEADASLHLKMVPEKYWLQPYISAGIGASKYKQYYGAIIPVGVGLKVNLFDEAYIFLNSQYRLPVTYETTAHHFYNSLGVAGAIGKKKEPKIIPPPPPPPPPPPADTDGDGITDDKDKCPTVKGVLKYEGCPVPDTDKDGINDDDDKCVTVPGVARYQGCPVPDTDKDGINDEEDKCPAVPGVARYQGCPVPDTDGDTVNDEEDKCPAVPGTVANQGCPEVSKEIITRTTYAAKNIFFETGKATLLSKSFGPLNDVVKIMKENPELQLTIEGHTDNTGAGDFNQNLSERRAAAVKNYLAKKGVEETRITSNGYGETQPVADNKTSAGRQKNRRVEMKPSY